MRNRNLFIALTAIILFCFSNEARSETFSFVGFSELTDFCKINATSCDKNQKSNILNNQQYFSYSKQKFLYSLTPGMSCESVKTLVYTTCKSYTKTPAPQNGSSSVFSQPFVAPGTFQNSSSCNSQDQKNCPPVESVCTSTGSCGNEPQKPVISQKEVKIGTTDYVQTKDEYTGKTSTRMYKDGKYYLVETNEKGKSKVYNYDSDDHGNVIGENDRIRGKEAKQIKEDSKQLEKPPEEKVQEVIVESKKEAEQKTQENTKLSEGKAEDAANSIQKDVGGEINTANQGADQTIQQKQPDAQNTTSPTSPLSQAEILKCNADKVSLKSAEALTKTLEAKQKACVKNFSVAEFVCPITKSPAAIIVSTSMTALTGILSSVPTASKTCKITNSVNLSTQSVMAAGSATCFASQALCESTCQAANQLPDQINSILSTITCRDSVEAASKAKTKLAKIKVENAEKISTCAEFKKDAAQMASLAANLGAAAAQAKSCADKLEAQGGGGGGPGTTVTTAQYCADPANANTSICKPGNSTMATMASIKTANTGGTSQMPGFNPATKPMSPNNANLDIGDEELNDAAGIPKTDESSASSGLTAADAASAGGAGGGSGSGGSGSNVAAGNEENSTSKSVGSLFSNAVNRMFGTSGSGSKANNKNAPIKPDYLNAAQRKLASEQLRSEISGASGTSNWDKIKNRYRNQQDSLIGN